MRKCMKISHYMKWACARYTHTHMRQLAFLEETKIYNVLSDAMAIHCASNSLLPNCLFLPEIIFAPYSATLAWSVVLLIAALMLCQGAFSGTSTASLTGFIYLSVSKRDLL
jgi:hypothetical protein